MLPCPYYSGDVVKRCLERNTAELVRRIEDGLGKFSAGPLGGIVQPVRNVVPVEGQNGMLLSMSALSATDGVLATKVVTFFPGNAPPNPRIQGLVLLMDARTGSLKAVMDAAYITAYRTAAASAVATKHLAVPNPKILAVLGAGVQADSHIRVLSSVFDLKEIRVWNYREASGVRLVDELGAAGIRARFVASVREAVRDADVIVTATSSATPVLCADWLTKGCHINAVGAPRPDWQELSSELMLGSVVYVDSREAALCESGDILKSGAEIYAEIGEVVLGSKENRRQETTVFKSLGIAIEDAIATDLIHRHLTAEDTLNPGRH